MGQSRAVIDLFLFSVAHRYRGGSGSNVPYDAYLADFIALVAPLVVVARKRKRSGIAFFRHVRSRDNAARRVEAVFAERDLFTAVIYEFVSLRSIHVCFSDRHFIRYAFVNRVIAVRRRESNGIFARVHGSLISAVVKSGKSHVFTLYARSYRSHNVFSAAVSKAEFSAAREFYIVA